MRLPPPNMFQNVLEHVDSFFFHRFSVTKKEGGRKEGRNEGGRKEKRKDKRKEQK